MKLLRKIFLAKYAMAKTPYLQIPHKHQESTKHEALKDVKKNKLKYKSLSFDYAAKSAFENVFSTIFIFEKKKEFSIDHKNALGIILNNRFPKALFHISLAIKDYIAVEPGFSAKQYCQGIFSILNFFEEHQTNI